MKNNRRKRDVLRIFRPSMRLYFALLVLFTLISVFFDRMLSLIFVLLLILLIFYSRFMVKRQKKEVLACLSNSQYGAGSGGTLMNMPLPTAVFSLKNAQILWSNEQFLQVTGEREHIFEINVTELIPDFSLKWLADGESTMPGTVKLGENSYRVYGNVFSVDSRKNEELWGVIYLADVTEYAKIEAEYYASRPVMAVIMLDNYDELFKSLNEGEKNNLLSSIDSRISEWCKPAGGYLWRYDRDRYIFIFEERFLSMFIENRFSVLGYVRELHNGAGIAATLSIGVGRQADTLDKAFQYAMLSIDMALSRGGDQAVIRDNVNFEFYGGHSIATEKRTKVKSRVMANAMGKLISDASKIIIMGHKSADMDCIGASAAMCCLARKYGKPAFVVLNPDTNVAKTLVDKLRRLPEYEKVFVTADEAILEKDSKTLLVVVDTNRPEQVESNDLLEKCEKIAVIDHHRRAADYISNAALNFHEPYASSACELTTELLQYLAQSSDILKVEAEAIMAGMVLDTKNFTMRTGSRTFEAAAFLRREGSDTSEVRKLFQNDLKSTVLKFSIISNVVMYHEGIAIAAGSERVDRVIAAQAADELLNIDGVSASFVICDCGDTISISGRSTDDINVQYILEKLGGGGNKTTAGAQIKGKNTEQLLPELKEVIDEYLKERKTAGE